jgi:hypothetical protein
MLLRIHKSLLPLMFTHTQCLKMGANATFGVKALVGVVQNIGYGGGRL